MSDAEILIIKIEKLKNAAARTEGEMKTIWLKHAQTLQMRLMGEII